MDNQEFEIKKTSFSDKWGTFKYLTDIHSDIKQDITVDFILAKFTETQKEAVVELVRDAYYIKKELCRLKNFKTYRVDENGKYIRNDDGTIRKFPLCKSDLEYIDNIAKITFNSYMIKIIMKKIEYRNVENNVLLELMTEKNKLDIENMRLEEENKDLLKRAKNNIKKGDEE